MRQHTLTRNKKALIQMTTELERNGGYEKVDVIGIISYFVDTRYGQDADGNRGEVRTIVDEVTDITVCDMDVNTINVTAQEEDFLAYELTRKFLEG